MAGAAPGPVVNKPFLHHRLGDVFAAGTADIRCHAIFHDVLGTVRVVDGRIVYDWSKIEQLYDDSLSKGIRPFVELGFTPQVLTPERAAEARMVGARIWP